MLLPVRTARIARIHAAGATAAGQRRWVCAAPRAFTSTPAAGREHAGEERVRSTPGSESGDGKSSASLPPHNVTPLFPPKDFPPSFGSNQLMAVPPSVQRRLSAILGEFRAPVRFAFAYGSGVFPQRAAGPEHSKRPAISPSPSEGEGEGDAPASHGGSPAGEPRKMIDLVLAVSHPEHWHGLNRAQFPGHYSTMSRSKLLGAEFLTGYVQRAGAGLWYMPYVRMGGDGQGRPQELVKYGVVDIDTLCADLLDWDTLYLSGRMHKPVAMLLPDPRVRLAQQVNLASALRVALLLLPERFSEVQLYTQIASISYMGDFRMSVPGGENANKVRNIVLAQREQFRGLYGGLLRSIGTVQVEEGGELGELGERSEPSEQSGGSESRESTKSPSTQTYTLTQDTSPRVRAALAARLPLRLREKILQHYLSRPHLDAAFRELAKRGAVRERGMGVGLERAPAAAATEETQSPRSSSSSSSSSQEEEGKPTEEKSQGGGDEAEEDAHSHAFWLAATSHPSFPSVLSGCIAATVKGPAWSQSVKGVYTAGLGRTLRYVGAKVGKWVEGRRGK